MNNQNCNNPKHDEDCKCLKSSSTTSSSVSSVLAQPPTIDLVKNAKSLCEQQYTGKRKKVSASTCSCSSSTGQKLSNCSCNKPSTTRKRRTRKRTTSHRPLSLQLSRPLSDTDLPSSHHTGYYKYGDGCEKAGDTKEDVIMRYCLLGMKDLKREYNYHKDLVSVHILPDLANIVKEYLVDHQPPPYPEVCSTLKCQNPTCKDLSFDKYFHKVLIPLMSANCLAINKCDKDTLQRCQMAMVEAMDKVDETVKNQRTRSILMPYCGQEKVIYAATQGLANSCQVCASTFLSKASPLFKHMSAGMFTSNAHLANAYYDFKLSYQQECIQKEFLKKWGSDYHEEDDYIDALEEHDERYDNELPFYNENQLIAMRRFLDRYEIKALSQAAFEEDSDDE